MTAELRWLTGLAEAGLAARSRADFRGEVLDRLAARVAYDLGLFHALSPRVPLATMVLRGAAPAAIARTVPRWDELAVALGGFLAAARTRGGLACDDEAIPRRGPARRAFDEVAGALGVRTLAVLHVPARGGEGVGRIAAAVVLGRRRARPFTPDERALLRAAIPVIALGDARPHPGRRRGLRERVACLDQRLTPRQREIVEYVALGHTNAAIARALRLSPNTLRNHLVRVFARLGAANRADVVRLAVLELAAGR
ncbi:MAG: helix-turn-helix transcriptional regulator [Deltaproteobacteria bacterium]|nr:helix-turn-helix transcriptional regulator [Deltaproteobacteria bacterium]